MLLLRNISVHIPPHLRLHGFPPHLLWRDVQSGQETRIFLLSVRAQWPGGFLTLEVRLEDFPCYDATGCDLDLSSVIGVIAIRPNSGWIAKRARPPESSWSSSKRRSAERPSCIRCVPSWTLRAFQTRRMVIVTRRAVSTLSTQIEVTDYHVVGVEWIDSTSACTSERRASWLVLQFRLVLAKGRGVVCYE